MTLKEYLKVKSNAEKEIVKQQKKIQEAENYGLFNIPTGIILEKLKDFLDIEELETRFTTCVSSNGKESVDDFVKRHLSSKDSIKFSVDVFMGYTLKWVFNGTFNMDTKLSNGERLVDHLVFDGHRYPSLTMKPEDINNVVLDLRPSSKNNKGYNLEPIVYECVKQLENSCDAVQYAKSKKEVKNKKDCLNCHVK